MSLPGLAGMVRYCEKGSCSNDVDLANTDNGDKPAFKILEKKSFNTSYN